MRVADFADKQKVETRARATDRMDLLEKLGITEYEAQLLAQG